MEVVDTTTETPKSDLEKAKELLAQERQTREQAASDELSAAVKAIEEKYNCIFEFRYQVSEDRRQVGPYLSPTAR